MNGCMSGHTMRNMGRRCRVSFPAALSHRRLHLGCTCAAGYETGPFVWSIDVLLMVGNAAADGRLWLQIRWLVTSWRRCR